MIGKIFINGEIGVETTLLDVIKQVKNQPQATEFICKIDSIGGFVDAGDDIYNYLKNLTHSVTTYAVKAYSIASKIFMAGDKRIVNADSNEVLMIHLPWMEVTGDHSTISSHLKDLKATEDDLVNFYSECLQIDKNTIQSLLTQETYLNSNQAIELGFATEILPVQKAVARLHNNKEKEEESLMTKFSNKIDAIYNKLMGIKNELILQDGSGLELVFPDLADGDLVEVDSKVTVDGSPAEGDFIMPDGSTITAVNGSVTKITPKVEEEVTEDETVAVEDDEKDAKIAELQAKIADLEAQLSEKVTEEQADKMLDALAQAVEKTAEIELKFQALAKQVGSDFTTNNEKETQSATAKAKEADKPKFSIKRK